jgi:hypothetical protein
VPWKWLEMVLLLCLMSESETKPGALGILATLAFVNPGGVQVAVGELGFLLGCLHVHPAALLLKIRVLAG